jgi:hypothetical protein
MKHFDLAHESIYEAVHRRIRPPYFHGKLYKCGGKGKEGRKEKGNKKKRVLKTHF